MGHVNTYDRIITSDNDDVCISKNPENPAYFNDSIFFEFGIKSDMTSAKHATNEEKIRTAIATTYRDSSWENRAYIYKYQVETSFTEDQINVKLNTETNQKLYDKI